MRVSEICQFCGGSGYLDGCYEFIPPSRVLGMVGSSGQERARPCHCETGNRRRAQYDTADRLMREADEKLREVR